MSNIVSLQEYRKEKKTKSVLVNLNLKEIFKTKGREFLIGLLEYILNTLKEN